MNDLVRHIPKIAIWFRDENRELSITYIDAKHKTSIQKALEASKFLSLPDGLMIPVRAVEKVDFNASLNNLDQFLLSLPLPQRKYLRRREEEMKKSIGRGISDIDHATRILARAEREGLI